MDRATILERLRGRLPRRANADLALVPSGVERFGLAPGYTVVASGVSGLSASEAMALVEWATMEDLPLHGLTLHGRGSSLDKLADLVARPTFGRVRTLSIASMEDVGRLIGALAESPHASSLCALHFGAVSGADVARLADGPFDLRALRATGASGGPDVFGHLARGRAFAKLEEIELPESHCGERQIGAWVESGRTRSVRMLCIPNFTSGAIVDGMHAIAGRHFAAADWSSLRTLDLGSHEVGEDAVRRLLGSATLRALTHLRLEGVGATGDALEPLASRSDLAPLEELDLYRNVIGPAGARHVAKSAAARGVRVLRLFAIEDEGARALAEGSFDRVETLGLERCRLGPDGAEALAGAPWMKNVRRLDLTTNAIGERGALALATSPNLARVERLSLYQNGVGARGAEALLSLPSLQELEVYDNGVGREASARLASMRPHVKLTVS